MASLYCSSLLILISIFGFWETLKRDKLASTSFIAPIYFGESLFGSSIGGLLLSYINSFPSSLLS